MMEHQNNLTDHDYLVKVLLIGDPASGKTSFLKRFANEGFVTPEEYKPTLDYDFRVKLITDPETNKRIKIQLWDSPSISRIKGAANTTYRGAHGILYLVDVTSSESLKEMIYWFKTANESTIESVKLVVAASKTDDSEGRQVSKEQIRNAIQEGRTQREEWKNISVQFIEISAKSDYNIMEAIKMILKSLKLDATVDTKHSNTDQADKKDKEKCSVM